MKTQSELFADGYGTPTRTNADGSVYRLGAYADHSVRVKGRLAGRGKRSKRERLTGRR